MKPNGDTGEAAIPVFRTGSKYMYNQAVANAISEVGRENLKNQPEVFWLKFTGCGKFFIEDKEFEVEKGDLVFIPKNTKYRDTKGLKLLAISVPKFNVEKRVRFD